MTDGTGRPPHPRELGRVFKRIHPKESGVPTLELSLRDDLDTEITQLVQRGEFLNREQAIEDLLQRGVAAYDTGDTEDRDPFEEGGAAGDYSSQPDDPI
jgi:Arc/MetJ-type ribon-helix-helix transcriptional regulator